MIAAALVVQGCATGRNTAPPSQEQTSALLNSDKDRELDRRFSAVQRAYESGQISDEQLRDVFRVFYDTAPALERHLNLWVERYPKSYVARLARGLYYKHIGLDSRGTDFADRTTTAQRTGMEVAFAKASLDFDASEQLTRKPLLSYFHAMDISRFEGEDAAVRRLYELAVKTDPHNYIARLKMLDTLRIRWGGSVAQMQEFLQKCYSAGLSTAQMHSLEGLVAEEQGWADVRVRGDYDAAERDYKRAASLEGENCTPCFNIEFSNVLLHQKKYADAIPILTRMLNADPHDISTLATRGDAYRNNDQIREAIADWTRAVEAGDAYSEDQMGRLYVLGVPGVLDADFDKGLALLRSSAAQGFEYAPQDIEVSLKLHESSAQVH